jgi:hypothetical protein
MQSEQVRSSDFVMERMHRRSEWLVCLFTFHLILTFGFMRNSQCCTIPIVISCALAMLLSSSGVLEFLFTLSLIHGPFVLYQRLALIRSRCKPHIWIHHLVHAFILFNTMYSCQSALVAKREPAVTLWREAVLLKQANMEVETKLSSMRKDELRCALKFSILKVCRDLYLAFTL